jgi:hypothetical protein
VFKFLKQKPVIAIRKTATAPDMAFSTASLAVNRFCGAGILAQSAEDPRNRNPYLAPLRGWILI